MSTSLGRRAGRALPNAAGAIALLALLATGCNHSAPASSKAEVREPPKTALAVLERVVEAYHRADSYQDDGRLLVRYTYEGKAVSESRKFSLALAAPNRIRVRAYDALAICDGTTFYATIDEAPGEVLSAAAPDELSPPQIYGDLVLGKALNQIVGSIPLSLFLDPAPMLGLLYNAQAPELDSPEKIGDDNCYRVRVARREGPFVFWIDQRTFVVRRVEYPPGGYRRVLEPYPGAITDMTITAELEAARLDPPIDDAVFHFDVPRSAEFVTRFDAVRVGGRIPKFKLRALDGQPITRDSLADKIAVIKLFQKDTVANYHDDLAGFEQVRKRYQDNDAIVFLAVNADSDDVSDEELKAEFSQAGWSAPIARVARQVAFRSFGLQMPPTTVVLGRNGVLQEHMAGAYPNQIATLPKNINTLLAGGDLFLEAPQESPNYSFYSGFVWQDAETTEGERPAAAALAPAAIAPPGEPKLLRSQRLWICSGVKRPGNILVVPGEAGRDRVLVLEGSSSVAEVDAAGKVSLTRRLELPEGDDAAISYLRTAADGAGRRYFLGAKAPTQQIHLFDAGWKRLLSYPEFVDHPGISDAMLADLDADGELEMVVAYLAEAGVHGVALDGERLWRNRAAENALRLEATAPDRRGQRRVLAAQGILLPIDASGREQAPILLAGAFVRLIFSADLGDGSSKWCAIALKSPGSGEPLSDVAVGLTPRGDDLWSYPLPAGARQRPASEMVASGNLLGGELGQWVIAGADGSIHILASDGGLIDHFNYGAAPTGMAIAHLDGQPALLIATDDAVEAWRFDVP